MAGLQGVANTADDLIVHGRDTEEHDKNLHSVLQRLSEKQLTLNAEKCTFRMTKVVFMGLLLSKHGVGPGIERWVLRLQQRCGVWWPAMDRDAKKRCAECYGCQMVTKNVPPPPLKSTPLPNQPWEEVAVDLMGPLPSGEHLLVPRADPGF